MSIESGAATLQRDRRDVGPTVPCRHPGDSRRGSGTTASSPRASVPSRVRRYPVFVLLVATDPRFAEHDPGRRHPERPQRVEAVLAGLDDAGHDAVRHLEPRRDARRARASAHVGVPRRDRACLRGGWRRARSRHLRVGAIVGGRDPCRGRGSRSGCRARTRRRRRGVLRGAPARAPRAGVAGDGVLLGEQRRGDRGASARPGRLGARDRLGRPPRQRDAGDLRRRCRGVLRLDARVAAVPGHRADRRDRFGAGHGYHVELPVPGRHDRRRLSRRDRQRGRADRRAASGRIGC